jgi:hypothetical protein
VLPLPFLSTVQLRSIVDTTYIESIHERERGRCGDSGIHPRACCGRIAGVSRACRFVGEYQRIGCFTGVSGHVEFVSLGIHLRPELSG